MHLNNPIIIFKCDPKYIHSRIFLFSDLEEKVQPALEDKTVPKKKFDPVKEEFLKMVHDTEPLFPNDVDRRPVEEKPKQNEEKVVYPDEINEYTDTLTTWVKKFVQTQIKSNSLNCSNKI